MTTDDPTTRAAATASFRRRPPDTRVPETGVPAVPASAPVDPVHDETPPVATGTAPAGTTYRSGASTRMPSAATAHVGGEPADDAAPTARTSRTRTQPFGTPGRAWSEDDRAATDEAVLADPPYAGAPSGETAPDGADPGTGSADAPSSGTGPVGAPSDEGAPLDPGTAVDAALVEAVLAETSGTGTDDGTGDERIRTLIWTAATHRPLEEVAALVTQLKNTEAVDSPADEALCAAAVARPLEEVRQLVAMLNEAGHTLDENDTALRAAAVGRPVEDVVQLVGILGGQDPAPPLRPDSAPGAPSNAGTTADGVQPAPESPNVRPPRSASTAPAVTVARTRPRPAAQAGGGTAPADRSPLRWPAAATLFACGVIHLPADFAGVWSGGYAGVLTLVIAVLCLVLGEWLIVRDTVRVWGSAAALSVGVMALHGMTGSSGVTLLQSTLGRSWTWSGAAAVTCAMLTALLAGSALLRRQRGSGAAGGT